jgi:predicted enzyme related to lactoylglutathione lyase
MIEKMTHVSLLVKDYEEALDFYVNKLGFVKVTDVTNGPMRFVAVAPQRKGTRIVFMQPNPTMGGEARMRMMTEHIGKAPILLFRVDDCQRTCDELKEKGVEILHEPVKAPYGIQAVIADLYGNPLLLLEHPHQ